jgi:hypothetical protein
MIDSWSRPNGCRASVHDGSFDGGARMSAFASHITLNKAWLHIGNNNYHVGGNYKL